MGSLFREEEAAVRQAHPAIDVRIQANAGYAPEYRSACGARQKNQRTPPVSVSSQARARGTHADGPPPPPPRQSPPHACSPQGPLGIAWTGCASPPVTAPTETPVIKTLKAAAPRLRRRPAQPLGGDRLTRVAFNLARTSSALHRSSRLPAPPRAPRLFT